MGGTASAPAENTTPEEYRVIKDVRPMSKRTGMELEEDYAKLSYYAVPESPYDDLPVRELEAADNVVSFTTDEIRSLDPAVCKAIVDALHTQAFFVVKLSEAEHSTNTDMLSELVPFFDSDWDTLAALHTPGHLPTGYKRIYFPNRDSKRDPEERDVFQIYRGDSNFETANWPEKPQVKDRLLDSYEVQFDIALAVLDAIATGLGVDPSELRRLLTSEEGGNVSSETASNTNMCVFHYWDDRGYSTVQKCMVHEDESLVTLLAKSSHSGIHLLSEDKSEWVEPEPLLSDGESLVYVGRLMELVTGGYIRAASHRVVREPGLTRYSMPFQLKANIDVTVLSLLGDSPGVGGSRLAEWVEWVAANPTAGTRGNSDLSLPCVCKDIHRVLDWIRVTERVARSNTLVDEQGNVVDDGSGAVGAAEQSVVATPCTVEAAAEQGIGSLTMDEELIVE